MNRPALRIVRDDDARIRAAPLGARIRHALACLDGSRASEACLPFAALLAEAFATEITVTRVLPSLPSESGVGRMDVLEWEIARREADQYLDRARALLEACGMPRVGTVVAQGAPAECIAATSRSVGADLTIVGGSTAPGLPALGATAQRVIASASGSILVAHETATMPPKRIVAPLDGSRRAELVLPTVMRLAELYDAELTLVHAVSERGAAPFSKPADVELARQLIARLEHDAESYLDRVRSRELRGLADVRRLVVACKDERRGLLEVLPELGADLVVLAAHGATCAAGDRFGGIASHVLSHARVPVLVLQDLLAPSPVSEVQGGSLRASLVRLREEA